MKKKSLFFTLLIFVFGLGGLLGYFDVQSTYASSVSASVWDGSYPASITDDDFYKNSDGAYHIKTAKGLVYFVNQVNSGNLQTSTIYLETDIDLDNKSWTPIGNSSQYFSGTFDGQSHTIYNMSISSANVDYAGFFGYTTATVKNLYIKNFSISASTTYTGGLAGYAYGSTISSCSLSGAIETRSDNLGGIVGYLESSSKISCCESDVSISISNAKNSDNIGGIVGNVYDGTLEYVYSKGNISANAGYVGGLIGQVKAYLYSLENSFNVGTITSSNGQLSAMAGFIGYCAGNAYNIKNCYNAGKILDENQSGNVAGLVGLFEKEANMVDCFDLSSQTTLYQISSSNGVFKNIYNKSNLSELESLAKIRSFYSNAELWTSSWDFDKVWNISTSVNNSLPYLRSVAKFDNDVDYSNESGLAGEGTANNPYLIRTAGDLAYLSFNYTSLSRKYFSLQNNIDLRGKTWQPIGNASSPFSGVFDGNGYTISGLTCSLQEQFTEHALFGSTTNAVIKNLKVEDFFFINSPNDSDSNSAAKGSIIGYAQSGTYLINCVDNSGISDLKTVGSSAKNDLYVAWGKENINSDGTVNTNTLNLIDNSYTSCYDVEIDGNGGLVYNSEGELYLGSYHILLDKSGYVVVQTIDSTFGKNVPTTSESFGITDVIIKVGYKISGYKDKNNNVFSISSSNNITTTYVAGGLSAVWEERTLDLTVVYNKYEQDNFGVESEVSSVFTYKYDEKFSENELATAISTYASSMRANFDIEGIYKIYADDKLESENTTKIFANDSFDEDNILYVIWKGTENENQLSIIFNKGNLSGQDGFEKLFDFSSAIDSVVLSSYENDSTIAQSTTLNGEVSGDSYIYHFGYNTLFSDKAVNYLKLTIILKDGYQMSSTVVLNQLSDSVKYNGVYSFGKLKTNYGLITESQSVGQTEFSNGIQFFNLDGDYTINIEITKMLYEKSLSVSQDVSFGVSPNVNYNLNKIYVKSITGLWDKITDNFFTTASIDKPYNLGFDFLNKKFICNDASYNESISLESEKGSNYIRGGDSVWLRYGEGEGAKYYRYVYSNKTDEQGVAWNVYTLYETDENEYYLDKLVQLKLKDDAQMTSTTETEEGGSTTNVNEYSISYLTGATFSFIFSTQNDAISMKDYTIFNQENYAQTSELITDNNENAKKIEMLFNDLNELSDKDGKITDKISVITKYVGAFISFTIVDRENVIINDPDLALSITNGYTYDISVKGAIEFDITSSKFYQFYSETVNNSQYSSSNNGDPSGIVFGYLGIAKYNIQLQTKDGMLVSDCFETGIIQESEKDKFHITLNYNADVINPGSYNLYIVCDEVDYTLEFETRFINYDERASASIDKLLSKNYFASEDGLPIVQAKTGETDFSETPLAQLRYDDTIYLQTALGDNNAFEFYGWFVGSDYLNYGQIVPTEISKIYSNLYSLSGNDSKYTSIVYAVYVLKQVKIGLSNYVWEGETRSELASKGVSDTKLIGGGIEEASVVYNYGDSDKLTGFSFDLAGFNANGYYISGYKLVDDNGKVVTYTRDSENINIEGKIKSSETVNGEDFDLLNEIKILLEQGKTSLRQNLYIAPVIQKRIAVLNFYSGTGLNNSFGDGKNGEVFDSENNETTNEIITFESKFGEYLTFTDLNDVNAESYFASRTGYSLPNYNKWTWTDGESTGLIYNSEINLSVSYFEKITYDSDKQVWKTDLHFYRNWNVNTYQINFQPNSGSFVDYSLAKTIDIEYDSLLSEKIVEVPTSINIKKTGYILLGWTYQEADADLLFEISSDNVVSLNVEFAKENGIIDEDGNYKKTELITLYALWQAETYQVDIYFNSANSINDEAISLDEQIEYKRTYSIVYDSTFANLESDTLALSSIVPKREGFVFEGFYIIYNNTRYKISDETKFTADLFSCDLDSDPALTLYVAWRFDENYLALSLDKTNFVLTYNASAQTIYISDYFKEGYTSSGFVIDSESDVLEISLDSKTHTNISVDLTSESVTVDDANKSFSVFRAGSYNVKLNIQVTDKAKHFNLSSLWTKNIVFYVDVNKADLSIEEDLDEIRLTNVKRIMSSLVDSETKGKIEDCTSFDEFASVIKTLDSTAESATNEDIYNFVMVKYYLLINTNVGTEHSTYRSWKYSDFESYNQQNQANYILSVTKFFDFFDHTTLDLKEKDMKQVYGDALLIYAENILSVYSELKVSSISLVSSTSVRPRNSYTLRIYLQNLTADSGALLNYNVYYDADNNAYLPLGSIYILPEILQVENLEETKSSYFNINDYIVQVDWEGNRTKISNDGKNYYTLEENVLYAYASIYTSNKGSASEDTTYNFYDAKNYLYFDDVGVIIKRIESESYVYEDISTYFKLVMKEDDVYKILNTNGVAEVKFTAKYLTKTSGVVDFLDMPTNLISNVLRITCISFELNGETITEYNTNGLDIGPFSYNGVMVYQIIENNNNSVSVFTNGLVKEIMVTSTMTTIGDYIGFYKWSKAKLYNVDGTMDMSGSYTLKMSEVNFSESGITSVNYNAIFTDLVLVDYDLNFPESFETYSPTKSVLQLGVSTESDLYLPSERGFSLYTLQAQTLSGDWIDYKQIFNGETVDVDGEQKATFVGLSSSSRFSPINLKAKWTIEDISYRQNAEIFTYAVGAFDELYYSDIVYIYNMNSNIFDYSISWTRVLPEGDLIVSENQILQLENNGSYDESGVYRLEVLAKVKNEFLTSTLQDPTKNITSFEVLFNLEFVRNKIISVTLPEEHSLNSVYDSLEHKNSWKVAIEYLVYNQQSNDYDSNSKTLELYYAEDGAIYFEITFNGNKTSTIKNAGNYLIQMQCDSNVYILEEDIDESTLNFEYVVSPFIVDLQEKNLTDQKVFNGVEPTLIKDLYLANENVSVSFTRQQGEDVGNYDLYFADVLQDYKANYTFKFGDVTIFENGTFAENGQSVAVGVFRIISSGILRISYNVTASNPSQIDVPYSADGYSFAVTDGFKLQIYKGQNLYKEIALILTDIATGLEVTNSSVRSIIKDNWSDLSFAFFDSEPRTTAYNSETYSYYVSMGETFSKYFSAVEFDSDFKFVINKILISVTSNDVKKIFDGKQTNYYSIDFNEIDNVESYSDVYIVANYETSHVTDSVKVTLNITANESSSVNIGNYILSDYVVVTSITKLNATMTILTTKSEYVYGEVSLGNLDRLVNWNDVTVKTTDDKDVKSLLESNYFSLTYKLGSETKTNSKGFVYVGSYVLGVDSTFNDFDMTLDLPTFTISQLEYIKTFEQGFITITTSDKVAESYSEDIYVSSTGDVFTATYRPVDSNGDYLEAGQSFSAGLYQLNAINSSVADGNILLKTTENNGFVVVLVTDTIYLEIENPNILQGNIYNSENYVLSVDKENKTFGITNLENSLSSNLKFYKKDDLDVKTYVADINFSNLEIYCGTDDNGLITSFESAGTYRLMLYAVSEGYTNIIFAEDYNFIISPVEVDASVLNFTKSYNGNAELTISSFVEKIGDDEVSIFAKFEDTLVGTNKTITTIYLQGVDSSNYQLINTSSLSGSITKVVAQLALDRTSYVYGVISKQNEFAYSVKTGDVTIPSSQYQITFTLKDLENNLLTDTSYSLLDYLIVGTYKIDAICQSDNYDIVFEATTFEVTAYQLTVSMSVNGEISVSYGDPKTKEDTFTYNFTTPLFETIELLITRESGIDIGFYRALSAVVSGNSNYEVESFADSSSQGLYKITKAKQTIYVLFSDEDTIDGTTNVGTIISTEYDGNLYNLVNISEREGQTGKYNLVISNSSNQSKAFALNYYTYDSETNVYTKCSDDVLVDSLTSTLKFLNPTTVKNVGEYAMYASGTTASNYEVRIGKNNSTYCFYLKIEKRKLYFKTQKQEKVFDNKNATFVYQDASEILDGVVDGENITLKMTFKDGDQIAKFVGTHYSVDGYIEGATIENYILNFYTLEGNSVYANITRAGVMFVVNTQYAVYGDEVNIEYSYKTDVDLTDYDMSRFATSINLSVDDSNYSTSGALKVGEYNMFVTFSALDFVIKGYVVDNVEKDQLTAKYIVKQKTLQLQAKEGQKSLQEIFTKTYDGNNSVTIKDSDDNLLFDVVGILSGDAVQIESASYANENIGEAIKISFVMTGTDFANYQLSDWNYGVITSINISINFNYNAGENNVTSNVDDKGLETISTLSYPFMSKSYLTANSADANTKNLQNFPTSLHGKTGYTFSFWSMDFENVENASSKYNLLDQLATKLNMTTSYINNVYSVKVENNSKTVEFLNSLIDDEQDLFGLYFANNQNISVTFNANWNVNKYQLRVQLADENGKSAQYGNVEIYLNGESEVFANVTNGYSVEVDYNSKITLKAKTNSHCFFVGFYSSTGNLYDGSEEFIDITTEANANVLTISNVKTSYDFVVRMKAQKINLQIDLSECSDARLNSSEFVKVEGENKYVWSTDYVSLNNLTFADLPEIERAGYDLISYLANGSTIVSDNFASTKLNSLITSTTDQLVSVVIKPNFDALGISVVLDYGYGQNSKTIYVKYEQQYNSSSDWIETLTRTGYDFVGWFDSNENQVLGTDVLQTTQAQTLTAKWTKQKFSITLNSPHSTIEESSITFVKNGQVYFATEIEFETVVTFKVVPQDGYTILDNFDDEFLTSMNADGSVNVTLTMPAKDVNFTIGTQGNANTITFAGEYLGQISAYDITENEDEIQITGNQISLETGRKLKVVVSAETGYEMTEDVTFDNEFNLSFRTSLNNEILTIEISGIFQDIKITFKAKESINDILIKVSEEVSVERVYVNGTNYINFDKPIKTTSQTNQNLIVYVKYNYGYTYLDCSVDVENNYIVNASVEEEGNFAGYFKLEISNIYKDGGFTINSKLEKFTLNLQTISYNDDKQQVDVDGNKAFVNGETSVEVDYKTYVTLTYQLADTYAFVGWSKDGQNIFSNDQDLQYSVLKDETIYAIFSTMRYTITFATYDYYQIYTEYKDATKVQDIYEEISGGKFFDGDTQITSIELFYGASQDIIFKVPNGYRYSGFGYWNEENFVYIEKEEKVQDEVEISISSLSLSGDSPLKIYVVLKSYYSVISFKTSIDIDGEREEDIDVGYIKLQSEDGDDVNNYGYIEGSRVHYSEESFVDGALQSNKQFNVIAYSRDEIYIRIETHKVGYKFKQIIANDDLIFVELFDQGEDYLVYKISNIFGLMQGIEIEVLYKPEINLINFSFENQGVVAEAGAISIKAKEGSERKVWTSGKDYANVTVSAYTDSSFVVYAYIKAGYYVDGANIQISDENNLIVSGSLQYEELSIINTGYTGRFVFEVNNFLKENTIIFNVLATSYVVNLVEEGNTLAVIKNVQFNSAINLSENNSSNITIVDDRLQFVNGKLHLEMKKQNYNFEGYFTYENGAGVRYIDSNGDVVGVWKETGYVLNNITSKYQLTENAKLNANGEVEITLYLYWSYYKTRISFDILPSINTQFTAQDMVSGVDYTNSWFYSTSPYYIEVSFNTDIHIKAPDIDGYRFYKFVISQKNSEGIWLSDVVAYTNDIPWSTNEFDRIVECNIQVVYFAQIEVLVFGGEGNYNITQESSDTQAKILLQEGFVDTTKAFTIEAIEDSGYQFLRWNNTSTGESVFTKDMTLITNRKITLIMSLKGLEVTLKFNYDSTHGQILNVKSTSLDGNNRIHRIGAWNGDNFTQLANEIVVQVGDVVTFMLTVDYGFGVDWNRNDITFSEYSGGFDNFVMTISKDLAESVVEITPTFKNQVITIYITRDFAEDEKKDNAVDLNTVDVAGYTLYNGKKTDFVTAEKGQDIKISTFTFDRYAIASVVIKNYDNVFDDMSKYYANETITLSNVYLEANNIVGTIQIEIEYKRLLWENQILPISTFEGEGKEKNPYKIKSIEDLVLMMQYVNSGKFAPSGIRYRDSAFILEADINLKQNFWTPIGTKESNFNGYFDFNNHKITGISIAFVYDRTSYDGLFGCLGNGAIIVSNKASFWYVYMTIGIVVFLCIVLATLVIVTRKKKRIREKLSKK